MAITKADDLDLKSFPDETVFILDTNILYFVHSGYYLPTDSKSVIYSNLLQKLIDDNRDVVVSALSVQELLHLIERKSYEMYKKNTGFKGSKKDYRSIPEERESLQRKMQTVLTELSTAYKLIDGEIREHQMSQFIEELLTHHYDPIDYALVDGSTSCGKVVFISDDVDFQFDSKIDLVTANCPTT